MPLTALIVGSSEKNFFPSIQQRPTSAGAVDRLEQSFNWMLWLDERERRLVWSRAARVPWKLISSALGCDRSTAWRHWQIALTRIAGRLNAE